MNKQDFEVDLTMATLQLTVGMDAMELHCLREFPTLFKTPQDVTARMTWFMQQPVAYQEAVVRRAKEIAADFQTKH